MGDKHLILDDDAYREKFLEPAEKEESNWEELTRSSKRSRGSETGSFVLVYNNDHGTDSFIRLSTTEVASQAVTLVFSSEASHQPTPTPTRPTSSVQSLALSSGWEQGGGHLDYNFHPNTNKFTLTSGSFGLPWSLEAVIRPDSPRFHWSNISDLAERYYDYCSYPSRPYEELDSLNRYINTAMASASMAFFQEDDFGEEDYEEDPRDAGQKKGSVVAKTVRLPLSIASDMLVFILKLVWPGSKSGDVEPDTYPPVLAENLAV